MISIGINKPKKNQHSIVADSAGKKYGKYLFRQYWREWMENPKIEKEKNNVKEKGWQNEFSAFITDNVGADDEDIVDGDSSGKVLRNSCGGEKLLQNDFE